jgi:hypothetical protein
MALDTARLYNKCSVTWIGCACCSRAERQAPSAEVESLRTVQHVRGQFGQVPVQPRFLLIMDVMCVVGQCLRLTQEEVQRSPVLTRLEADGATGAVPLPFLMKFLRLWKHRVVDQYLSADDLVSVIEVRVAACQSSRIFKQIICAGHAAMNVISVVLE